MKSFGVMLCMFFTEQSKQGSKKIFCHTSSFQTKKSLLKIDKVKKHDKI